MIEVVRWAWPGDRVAAGGWWYGRYWLLLDSSTFKTQRMMWFDTPLEALVAIGQL